jgi:hypothetical protein
LDQVVAVFGPLVAPGTGIVLLWGRAVRRDHRRAHPPRQAQPQRADRGAADHAGRRGDRASSSCHDVEPALSRAILRRPNDFYVNVHTTEFPGGAIREQLKRG